MKRTKLTRARRALLDAIASGTPITVPPDQMRWLREFELATASMNKGKIAFHLTDRGRAALDGGVE